jgi:hypothetical protein
MKEKDRAPGVLVRVGEENTSVGGVGGPKRAASNLHAPDQRRVIVRVGMMEEMPLEDIQGGKKECIGDDDAQQDEGTTFEEPTCSGLLAHLASGVSLVAARTPNSINSAKHSIAL